AIDRETAAAALRLDFVKELETSTAVLGVDHVIPAGRVGVQDDAVEIKEAARELAVDEGGLAADALEIENGAAIAAGDADVTAIFNAPLAAAPIPAAVPGAIFPVVVGGVGAGG